MKLLQKSRLWRRRTAALALSLMTAVSLVSCSSTQVRTEAAPDASVAQYTNFTWAPPQEQDSSDRLSSRPDTILEGQLKSAVNADLTQKGYSLNTQAPDLKVAYSLRSHDQIRLGQGTSRGAYNGSMWDESSNDQPYIQKQGYVVLDFMDEKTGNLLWRGIAVANVNDTGATPQQVQKAVNKIMKEFPSHGASG